MSVLLCDRYEDAVVACVVQRWAIKNSSATLGRILIQKICYFLKAKGIPLGFEFDMYHYGPYSQDLYFRMDELIADGVIADQSTQTSRSDYVPAKAIDELLGSFSGMLDPIKSDIDLVIDLFSDLSPTEMELLATIHYFHSTLADYYRNSPDTETVIQRVLQAKGGKFSRDQIFRAYEALRQSGVLAWKAI